MQELVTARGMAALVTPAFLRFVGELLFGKRWQTPLADRLGAFRGKKLSPATIHQWSTRTRSIPAWVGEAIAVSLEDAEQDFLRRAKTARSIRERMRPAGDRDPAAADLAIGQVEQRPHARQDGSGIVRDASVAG
jgi:hypothetical protein